MATFLRAPNRRRSILLGAGAAVITVAAGLFDPRAAVVVVGLLGTWAVVARTTCDPLTLLSVFVVLLVIIPSRYVFGPLGAVGTPAVLIGLISAGWWTTSRLLPSVAQSAPGRQPVRTAILVFGWFTILTYGFAFVRALSGLERRAADRAVIALVALCGITLLTADGLDTREQLERLLRWVVVAAVLLAGFGILQFTTGVDPSQILKFPGLRLAGELKPIQEGGAVRRVAGTALHPIEFGVVLTMALPIALHFAFLAPAHLRRRRWVSVVLIAVAIPMSVSRSAIVGLVVVLLVLLPGWSWKRRVNVGTAIVLLCGVMQGAMPGLLGTIKSQILNAGQDPSVQGRTDDYGPLFDLWRRTPWLGRGLGTFDPGTYRFLDNQYLGTLIDSGVIGLGALILLFFVMMGTARGARRRTADPEAQSLARALLAAVAAAAATFSTFDAMSFPMNTGVLFVIFGCIGAAWRFAVLEQQTVAASPSGLGDGQVHLVGPEEVGHEPAVQ